MEEPTLRKLEDNTVKINFYFSTKHNMTYHHNNKNNAKNYKKTLKKNNSNKNIR